MASKKAMAIRIMLASSAATLLTPALNTPAYAHNVTSGGPVACGPLSTKSCGTGYILNSHTNVRACDLQSDGKGYYMSYKLRNGGGGLVGDANGAASGCGDRTVTTTSNPIVGYAGCGDFGDYSICNPEANA